MSTGGGGSGGVLKPLVVGWYRRRRPWIGAPPPPGTASGGSGGVPCPRVIRSDFIRNGLVYRSRPPGRAVAPSCPLRPVVVRGDFCRPGRVFWCRPPLHAPLPPVAGSVPPPRIIRGEARRPGRIMRSVPPPYRPPVPVAGGILPARIVRPHLPRRFAEGICQRLGWFSPPPGPIRPDRILRLRADVATNFFLRAASETAFSLRAAAKTSWYLPASETMSVPSNVQFFQGEDVQFTFALIPPTDLTGWTLTGTVKNKLGGVTQFAFTPTITDAGRGWFSASWTRSQTSALPPGDYVWDIRRIDSGKNAVLAHGEATVKQPVTP